MPDPMIGSYEDPPRAERVEVIDPPPVKWSALRYGFRAKEDHDAEEETQARGDCCEAAPGGCAGVAGAERCRRGTLDRIHPVRAAVSQRTGRDRRVQAA